MNVLYRVHNNGATFGIVEGEDGIVIEADPIASWSIGQDMRSVLQRLLRWGAHIEIAEIEADKDYEYTEFATGIYFNT